MRRTAFLLLLSAAAAANEVDLADIARIMVAREKATYPFEVRYRAEGYEARFAADATRRIWRGEILHEDRLWTRYDNAWLLARHEPGRTFTEWRGTVSHEPAFAWPVLPLDFGLEQASEPVSGLLTRRSARVAGTERVGAFDCVKVLVDWVHSDSRNLRHPLGLWLAPAHGYYPVRTVVYAPRDGSHLLPGGALELDGKMYVPREWREVEELAAHGAARFPVRGRIVPTSRDARPVAMEIVPGSLRLGVGDDAFALPSYMYLQDLRYQHGLWVTPVGALRISFLWIAIYLLAAAVPAYLVHRARSRRRRARAAEELAWEGEAPFRSETSKS